MPIKAIKNIVKKELAEFYNVAKYNHCKYCNDATQYIIEYGYSQSLKRLEACSDYESLDDFIGEWYRMSLREWIESL